MPRSSSALPHSSSQPPLFSMLRSTLFPQSPARLQPGAAPLRFTNPPHSLTPCPAARTTPCLHIAIYPSQRSPLQLSPAGDPDVIGGFALEFFTRNAKVTLQRRLFTTRQNPRPRSPARRFVHCSTTVRRSRCGTSSRTSLSTSSKRC